MQIRDSRETFGALTKLVHWTTVVLVLSLFAIGWYMSDLPLEPETFEIYALHKSLGITVLALTGMRLLWRLLNPTPRLLGAPPRWQRLAARAGHGLLYLLLIALPMTGWLLSSAADFLPNWFGLVELPALVEPDDGLRELTRDVHDLLGSVLLAVIVVHVAAALHHHVAQKDATLMRMLPWVNTRQ